MNEFKRMLKDDPEVVVLLTMIVCLFGVIALAMICETVTAVSA